jgi:hypothetical protein
MSDPADRAAAERLAELHRRADERRERQRRHHDLLGGPCSCVECAASGPVALSVPLDAITEALGLDHQRGGEG